jgi:catechol 2,3-dioxygenase-like lactoylglutathione lyase family enzyme
MNDVADHGIRFGRVAAMLPVKDMEKACAFYMKVLGFEPAGVRSGRPRDAGAWRDRIFAA